MRASIRWVPALFVSYGEPIAYSKRGCTTPGGIGIKQTQAAAEATTCVILESAILAKGCAYRHRYESPSPWYGQIRG